LESMLNYFETITCVCRVVLHSPCHHLSFRTRACCAYYMRAATWVRELEEATDAIRNELLENNTQSQQVFQPYRAPLWANPDRPAPDGLGSQAHDLGTWNVSYLLLHNVDFKGNSDRFPVTMRAVSWRDEPPKAWLSEVLVSLVDEVVFKLCLELFRWLIVLSWVVVEVCCEVLELVPTSISVLRLSE
jgi:hypothetical protein